MQNPNQKYYPELPSIQSLCDIAAIDIEEGTKKVTNDQPTTQQRLDEIEDKQGYLERQTKSRIEFQNELDSLLTDGENGWKRGDRIMELRDEIADSLIFEGHAREEIARCKEDLHRDLEARKMKRSFAARLIGTAALAFVTGLMFSLPFLYSSEEIVANVTAFFGGAK